ncbi:MAG: DUF4175 domain-containing protein [Saprospiraceae bacterium]|nr:DUF4175 domain-containing protein [Saprospiraceae bacterium]
MADNMSNYSLLINKLDRFIRKYYINKLIKGAFYTLGLIVALFLLFNILEYYFYFGTGVRKLLFGSFILTSIGALALWVIVPLSKYFKLGQTISHEQAANIIGDHFQGVEDKLLNVLQLKKQAESSAHVQLIEASIDQKTETITPIPFRTAIDLRKNRKYLVKYAVPPLLLFLFILFAAPSIIKEGTHRLINNGQTFEKEAPFKFVLEDKAPTVVQFDDYNVQIKIEGEVLPNEAFIEIDNFQYRLQKVEADRYSYTIRNVQKNTPFRVFSGKVSSEENLLKVLAKPNLSNFNIELDFPGYTKRKDEVVENLGDLVIPEGTQVKWSFNTLNTEQVRLEFASKGEMLEAEQKGEDLFYFKKRIRNNDFYKVFIANENVPEGDSVSYSLNVIKDQYPTINVEQFVDSLEKTVLFFVGRASDDYGLNSLAFHYNITKADGSQMPLQTVKLKDPASRETQYEYTFDIGELDLKPGQNVSYYFETKDNDGVNGSKSAKTGVMSFEKPSIEELKEIEDINEEAIKDNLEESLKKMEKLRENYKKMREKLLQEKELDWQDKKDLEKLLEEQKDIQEKLEKAKEKFEENLKNQEEMDEQKEEILEKQEKLQELFEEAVDPEKQELMDKIQELMQELEKESALEMMEQMEMDNESMEKEMDRLLELYKSLELEKEVKDQIEALEKLAEEQEKLAEETEAEKKTDEEIQKEQEELNEKMEELKEEMEKIEEKNEELEKPKNLGDENQEKMDDIQEDMEKSSEQMKDSDNKGASKSQKDASKKMKEMAGSLQSSMESGEQEQQTEDIKMIRQLLENLVNLSFDQENLINDLGRTRTVTPRYVDLVQEQFKLKDDFKLVEDSLTALANRNDQIESFVLEKVGDVKLNMKESLTELEARKKPEAADNQRRTMKNVNDLALMLAESMQSMQEQMGASMPGSQMCNKPGGQGQGKQGKVPKDKMSEGSQGMEEMMKGMQNKQGKGEKPSAKDFAQAAARQAAMRKALQDLQKEAKEQGRGTKELEEIIEEMNKIETDLVNKRLDSEMLKRQQDITTRLLEAEKAERQREFDNKRKAEVATEKKRELPPSLQEYIKKREAELEMYKTVSPALRPYYKYLVDEYYKALKGE